MIEGESKSINEADLITMKFTEKVIENNNSVSSAVTLMGETIGELAEAVARTEDKIDDVDESLESINNFCDLVKKSKILETFDNIKKWLYAIIIGLSVSLIWFVLQTAFKLYVKFNLGGVTP